ncbi:uncharacterized protein LOC127750998 [Frankliniella occidentalis]|uniref:Uncharacterized protein LOC127750998 n=1 Tax=Frankliniella occidentalis TaxID=133901 RepID=A0A9C6X6A9_FRAOC|nr:uncharacterized protein LOC127750998 [Frankliniella occidentalis]
MSNPKSNKEMIGSLLNLSENTRPDLSYVVSKLAQKCQSPTEDDVNDVKHVLRYLVSTGKYNLTYSKSGLPIKVFCDSDFAGDPTDRKSRCCYVAMLANSPISWYSKKHNCVALSTVEAEFIAMCEVTREVVWLKRLLSELGQSRYVQSPCTIFCDNQGAINKTKEVDQNVSERNKHIDIQYFYCKDMQVKGFVKFVYVPSFNNIADIFTKPLNGPKTKYFCEKLPRL